MEKIPKKKPTTLSGKHAKQPVFGEIVKIHSFEEIDYNIH
jgi:hypothetical protein